MLDFVQLFENDKTKQIIALYSHYNTWKALANRTKPGPSLQFLKLLHVRSPLTVQLLANCSNLEIKTLTKQYLGSILLDTLIYYYKIPATAILSLLLILLCPI